MRTSRGRDSPALPSATKWLEEFAHVGIVEAGGGEVEEGDVWEGRSPAAGAQGVDKLAPRDAQAECVGAREERRGGEV